MRHTAHRCTREWRENTCSWSGRTTDNRLGSPAPFCRRRCGAKPRPVFPLRRLTAPWGSWFCRWPTIVFAIPAVDLEIIMYM